MAVCHYFLQGRCSFGDRCRNEHPQSQPSGFGQSSSLLQGSSSSGAQSSNRFSAFGGGTGSFGSGASSFGGGAGAFKSSTGAFGGGVSAFTSSTGAFGKQQAAYGSQADNSGGGVFGKPAKAPAKGDKPDGEFLKKMVASRPLWQFSAFGLGGDKPNILTGTDISPEELQLDFVMAQRSGELPVCQQKYDQLAREMNEKLNDISVNADAYAEKWNSQFGAESPKSTAFGQATPTSTQTVSAFGQTKSAFGGAGTSAFGQTTSSFGGAGTSAFGRQTGAFGGQSTSAFGGSNTSAFGQPRSALGQALAGSSGFGGSGGSAFGQQKTESSPFGQSQGAFGSSAQSAFGQSQPATAFGQTQPATAFGQSTGRSAFGSMTGGQQTSTGFGKAPVVDASATDPLEQLSAQDIECFMAPHFTMGAIPEAPPTAEFR